MRGPGSAVFLHYYWAANVRIMVSWQYGFIPPPWLAIEKSLTSKTSLPALLFPSPRYSTVYRKDHFVLLNAQKIWNQIRKCCVLPDTSVNAPIWQNHDFLPSRMDTAFREWSCKGIVSLKDPYVDGHLGSFEQLQSKFSLSNAHFSQIFTIETLCSTEAKHLISGLVGYFSSTLDSSAIKIKQAWEGELGIEIEDKSWEEVLTNFKSCWINARLQLIQYKIVHRLDYSKT